MSLTKVGSTSALVPTGIGDGRSERRRRNASKTDAEFHGSKLDESSCDVLRGTTTRRLGRTEQRPRGGNAGPLAGQAAREPRCSSKRGGNLRKPKASGACMISGSLAYGSPLIAHFPSPLPPHPPTPPLPQWAHTTGLVCEAFIRLGAARSRVGCCPASGELRGKQRDLEAHRPALPNTRSHLSGSR